MMKTGIAAPVREQSRRATMWGVTDIVGSGPLAVVTGASSGIGLEPAPLIAADGFDPGIIAYEAEIQQFADELALWRGVACSSRLAEVTGQPATYDAVW